MNSLILDVEAAQSLAYLPERPAVTELLWSMEGPHASLRANGDHTLALCPQQFLKASVRSLGWPGETRIRRG
ncbi:MAG TPA: hypothetical protein VIL68_00210 [Propionibacteriaceae bacterium]